MERDMALRIQRLAPPISQAHGFEAALDAFWSQKRSAIYVLMAADGRIVMFAPFVNLDYRNAWSWRFEPEGLHAFLARAHRVSRAMDVLPDTRQWWRNGTLVCNVLPPGGWGESLLPELHTLLTHACARAGRRGKEHLCMCAGD
jgi:hypothetical protein